MRTARACQQPNHPARFLPVRGNSFTLLCSASLDNTSCHSSTQNIRCFLASGQSATLTRGRQRLLLHVPKVTWRQAPRAGFILSSYYKSHVQMSASSQCVWWQEWGWGREPLCSATAGPDSEANAPGKAPLQPKAKLLPNTLEVTRQGGICTTDVT